MGAHLCEAKALDTSDMLCSMRRRCAVCQRLFDKPRNQKMAIHQLKGVYKDLQLLFTLESTYLGLSMLFDAGRQ